LREFYDIQSKSYGIFSAESAQLLLDYDWPGNIRQLRNVMERLSVMTAGGLIEALDVRRALQIQEFIVEDHKDNSGNEQATINVSTEPDDKKPAPLDFALFISVSLGRFFAYGPFYHRVIKYNCFSLVKMLLQGYTAETLTAPQFLERVQEKMRRIYIMGLASAPVWGQTLQCNLYQKESTP